MSWVSSVDAFTDRRNGHSNAVTASSWTQSDQALEMLDARGGPFERRAFRRAYVAAVPGSRDVTFAASLPDGTLAALALISRGLTADSVPPSGYGTVCATRELSKFELHTFLDAARRNARVLALTGRTVRFDNATNDDMLGSASVIRLNEWRSYSRLASRSLSKATKAGASAFKSSDPLPFLKLYSAASARWKRAPRYPKTLVESLAADGSGVFHHVEAGGEVVSSLFTLVAGTHWMCWFAAQNARGRAISASYLAYDALLEEAHGVVEFVNLGASASASGGAQFKSHLGAFEAPIFAWRHSVPGWIIAESALAGARRVRARFS
jgi:Acetyltransferase (GNAT) domain